MTIYGLALAAFLTADAADLATTVHSPQRELNPIVGKNITQQVVVTAASDFGVFYLTRKLWKDGRKKTAVIILIGGAGAHGLAAIRNGRN